ncbi:MAG: mechanosensitive ion channel [Methylococcales bacterium]|nr:mechanosensitive ion channel [Methylococcales bacterium]MDD5753464.1 mechanosensitive ion channel [Methylococcales bacterium]
MNRILLHLFFLLLISLFNTNVVFSATPPVQIETNETITPEFLQSKITELNERQGLEESAKTAVLKQYQAIQDNLTCNAKTIEQIASFTLSIHQAPAQTKALQKEIEQTLAKLSKQKTEDFRQIPIEELEQRLILEKGKISRLDDKLKKIETDLVQQNNRPRLIREETVIAQQLIESTWKNLELPAAPSDSKLEHEARQLYFKTLIEARTTELKMLEVEAISQPARLELLKVQFQLFDIQKTALSPVVTMIEDLVFELRQQEAKKIEDNLSQTEKELENKHAVIQQYTRENIKYSRDLQAISVKIESASDQKNQIESKNNEIENEFKGADKKIILASVSPTLGKILREQRRNLISQNKIVIASHSLQNETALTSLEQLTVEDRQKQLLNLETTLKQIMRTQVDLTLPLEQRMMIQAELRVLLNNQKELLNKLAFSDAAYLRALGDLDFSRQQMLVEATKFAAYLDERLLWVPSSEPINLETLLGLYHSLQWLFSPTNWLILVSETLTVFQQNGLLALAAIGLLLLLVRLKQWAIQHSKLSETELRQWHTDHFYYTLRALLYLVLLNLPIPIAAYLLGSLLTHSGDVDFNQAIGVGLQKAAISVFIWQFCYAFFSVDGVARLHFQWRKSTVVLLHRHLAWLRFVVVSAMFLIQTTSASKVSEYSDALGRVTLLITLIAITFFVTKQLHPSRELWQPWLKKHESHWLVALPYACYALVIAVPLVIMGFTVMGYYLSALELQEKVISTLRLLMFTLIVHEIIFRWLTLVNRQLALQNAAQQRELHEKHSPILDDELPLDIPKINAQTRKLLHVTLTLAVILGFWLIWKNILPAFSFLDHIVLWQHKTIIENQESYQPITLTNLLLAGLYLFIAIVSVRNFSGVLELFVFRRWNIEAGSRYAINQLAKYFFITIAFIAIANELGGSWSQVQWLVAALGVGLGFGLQEIFANLVSGIILLFERPIRVGDTVTIGNVTGKVCRIQMRATTLIDWDQLELIVPNKTFITSQLTNWTLSDSTTRIIIPIGIAFGSDVEFAHALILQTVKDTPFILDEPLPSVLFMGFGESALNFSIRVFVSNPDNRFPVIHALNVRLERVLREHKIEIPYPQQDIHVKY